jgi:F420-0:gamma-glutamyl ligase-like protein
VTRLGEFPPVELVFSLQHFTKITKYSQTVLAIFLNGSFIVVNWTKYGLGYILGNILQKHLVTLVSMDIDLYT